MHNFKKHYSFTVDIDPLKMISQKNKKIRTNPSNGKFRGNYDINLDNPNYVKLLNYSYNINVNKTDIISFIMKNDLTDIILKIPKYIEDSFGNCDLSLTLENKYHNEKWIVVSILTNIDGETASLKLDQLEDELFDIYGDEILDNILLSVEFE